ncbi:MAG: 4-hydroxy-tetrahydrodipicolinate reductase [Victivallaceae bacterium]|nr:4-hydroxy-tetrahydrodipicolinate reductase [Victivallaceae bacterium]
MIKTAVIGAGGRMGRRLVSNILAAEDLTLVGASEAPGTPFIGQDAGILAGSAACGIKITADLDEALKNADAVINFSTGKVIATTRTAVAQGCSAVIGTTALSAADQAELQRLAAAGARIVVASNMSVGVNLLFHLCREAASILGGDYDVEIIEMHHNQKKDAPSGTAIRLAEIACKARGLSYEKDVRHGREGLVGARTRKEIGLHALRGGDVVGDHTVIFATGGERLELTHKASSRDTFATGALQAVRFLASAAPGLYDMQDVLKLK